MEANVFGDAEGEVYDAGGVRLRVLAQAPDQPIAVTDNVVPPGFPGPVRHRHARMTDAFYVLEGTLAFDLGGARRLLGPGGFVLVPPGGAHTFASPGSEPARFLNIYQPAGNEHYLNTCWRGVDERSHLPPRRTTTAPPRSSPQRVGDSPPP